LARSSKPRRRYRPERAAFQLTLTRGGGAELTDNETGEVVWASADDADFTDEFPPFLKQADLADILDYLEEVGELTARDADRCDIREEFIEAADLAGMIRRD
jgi:TusA-related sulfurtransferase